jgi:hypothetical protein
MDGDTLMQEYRYGIENGKVVIVYPEDDGRCPTCNSCGELTCCQHSCHQCNPAFDIDELLPYMEEGDWYTYTNFYGKDTTWVKGES